LCLEYVLLKGTADKWKSLPQNWRADVAAQLQVGETLLGWFEPDLDLRLNYALSLLVLTDRRLLAPKRDPLPDDSGEAQVASGHCGPTFRCNPESMPGWGSWK
jgi:hypothetical protein